MHQINYFGWGFAPDPTGEITALAQNPQLEGAGLLLMGMRGREGKRREED